MTDNFEYIDVNDERWEGTPRDLRNALDKAQKALKAANQTIAGFQTERAESALSGVLTGFRNPTRVKKDLLADNIDPLDNGAVEKWLSEFGDDYARATEEPTPPEQDQPSGDERQAARAQLDAVREIGRPGGPDPLSVINSMPENLSPQQAYEWLSRQGA